MQSHDMFKSAEDQATIADSLTDREKAPTGTVKVKVSKTKPSIEAIKARAKKAVKAEVPAEAVTEPVAE